MSLGILLSALTDTALVEHGVVRTERDKHLPKMSALTDTDLVEHGVVGEESDEHHALGHQDVSSD